jgi:hypothetical protein
MWEQHLAQAVGTAGPNSAVISCAASEDLSAYKISWSYIDWRKFCIHLMSLNVHHFGMIKNYYVKVTFNGMTSLLNFTIYQLVLKLMDEDRQDDHLINNNNNNNNNNNPWRYRL